VDERSRSRATCLHGPTAEAQQLLTEAPQSTAEIFIEISEMINVLKRQVANLIDHALVDHLTKLLNFRAFQESLEIEFDAATQAQVPIGLVLADVDHFKTHNVFNGELNHAVGDVVLQAIAGAIQASIRAADTIFPYRRGGDEFAIVLPHAGIDKARYRTEEISERITNMEVFFGSQRLPPVTVSFGVAAAPDNGETVSDLVAAAACALAIAKTCGGGAVVTAPFREEPSYLSRT
jgi:diguanylate cyclase (GGDEF)-like protein